MMKYLFIAPLVVLGVVVLLAFGFQAFGLLYAATTGACPNCLERGHDELDCPLPYDVY